MIPPETRLGASTQRPPSDILALMPLPAGDRELVQIMDAAFADAAHRAGPRLVCHPGCTQCCHGAFAINELDAQRIASGMEILRGTNPALAAEIQRRARIWLYEHGSTFPGDPRTGHLGDSDEERTRFDDYANQAPCPALDPVSGHCEIYQYRPMTCRIFGPPVRVESDTSALGHCELCFEGATTAEVAACEMQIPHDFEQTLLNEIADTRETIVAFALLR